MLSSIEICAGAGGQALGLSMAGFEHIALIEYEKDYCDTLKRNLIRNRKGNLPHIVVVTGEPMPARIASLALGTGDIDCVYHFALYELVDG